MHWKPRLRLFAGKDGQRLGNRGCDRCSNVSCMGSLLGTITPHGRHAVLTSTETLTHRNCLFAARARARAHRPCAPAGAPRRAAPAAPRPARGSEPLHDAGRAARGLPWEVTTPLVADAPRDSDGRHRASDRLSSRGAAWGAANERVMTGGGGDCLRNVSRRRSCDDEDSGLVTLARARESGAEWLV